MYTQIRVDLVFTSLISALVVVVVVVGCKHASVCARAFISRCSWRGWCRPLCATLFVQTLFMLFNFARFDQDRRRALFFSSLRSAAPMHARLEMHSQFTFTRCAACSSTTIVYGVVIGTRSLGPAPQKNFIIRWRGENGECEWSSFHRIPCARFIGHRSHVQCDGSDQNYRSHDSLRTQTSPFPRDRT